MLKILKNHKFINGKLSNNFIKQNIHPHSHVLQIAAFRLNVQGAKYECAPVCENKAIPLLCVHCALNGNAAESIYIEQTHREFPSASLPAPLSQPQWVIKADTWQPTFRSKASAHSEAMGLMSASIILTFKMTLASAYTAITDAWVLSARGGKYNCKSIQVSAQVLLTAITETKSPSERAEVAITSLKGGLLIFCSVRTCLLALQVSELGLQLKNAHTQRHSRDTLKHLASV